MRALLTLVGVGFFGCASPKASRNPDTPVRCAHCDEWNAPQLPFRIIGTTYYVGVRGLSAVAIDTGQGLILLDGDLPQSVPEIEANLKALGLRIQDVKLIVNSHAHYDHAGGLAALQRDSGAQVVASPRGAEAIRAGCPSPDDPQAGDCAEIGFPPVANVRTVADGEVLTVGNTSLTAHLTPGHTPGSTTWSWQACEASTWYAVVYADSLNPVSAEGFRFSGDRTHPDVSATLAQSIDRVAALSCDVLITVHPEFADIFSKSEKVKPGAPNPFIERDACRAYAQDARDRLATRLAQERSPTKP